MNNKIISLEYLDALCEGDPEFKKDLIRTFLTNSPRKVEEIKSNLQAKEYKKLGDLAHSIKPSFTLMGMNDHKEIALHIEKFGRETRNLDELPGLVNKLDEVISKACNELKVELDSIE